MGYKVRVRGVEIECDSLDDVDDLVERYGNASESVPLPRGAAPATPRNSGSNSTGGTTDTALLKALVQSGPSGVTSSLIGGMLNAQRKGIPSALTAWASRVGLPDEACVAARPGGKRGWRLNEGALVGAREILGH